MFIRQASLLGGGKTRIESDDAAAIFLSLCFPRRDVDAADAIKVNHFFHFASWFLILVPRTASAA